MSPSGGCVRELHSQVMTSKFLLEVTVLFLIFVSHCSAAKPAKDVYFMDQSTSCFATGFQEVARDQEVIIHGRSDVLGSRKECRIMLEPQKDEDTITVELERISIVNDPEVKLSVSMASLHDEGGSFTFGSEPQPLPLSLEAVQGRVTIILNLPETGDPDFTIRLRVTVKQTIDTSSSSGSSSVDAGLIIGLVTAFIIIIIIIAIIALCLVQKRKAAMRDKHDGTVMSTGPHRTFERVDYIEKDSSASNLSLSMDKRSLDF